MRQSIIRLERGQRPPRGGRGGYDMEQSGDMATTLKPVHHSTTYGGL